MTNGPLGLRKTIGDLPPISELGDTDEFAAFQAGSTGRATIGALLQRVLGSEVAEQLNTLEKIATAIGNDPNFAQTLQTALALLAPKESPAFTGAPTAPTAVAGTNTAQLATTAFVRAAVAALVGASPATLDTLNELATALGNDPNFATTITNQLAGKANAAATTTALAGKADATGGVINDLALPPRLRAAGHQVSDWNGPLASGLVWSNNAAANAPVANYLLGIVIYVQSNFAVVLVKEFNNDNWWLRILDPANGGSWLAWKRVRMTEADLDARYALVARAVNTSGLASGGGNLSADRTISVPIATTAEAQAGAIDTKAMTPLKVSQAIAANAATGAPLNSPNFTGEPKAPTPVPGTSTTQLATTAFVMAALAALVGSSPAALDTLNELATALGNDPNFATTITNQLAGKASTARAINTSGLASGGGNLTADRTIDVPIATTAEAQAGAIDTKAMTPLKTAQAIAVLAEVAAGQPIPPDASTTNVGTVMMLARTAGTNTVNQGNTLGGSNLRRVILSFTTEGISLLTGTTTMPGTWMNVSGNQFPLSGGGITPIGYWVRTA